MTQPTKREELAAMRLEDFKAHLRTIAGEDPNAEIVGAARSAQSGSDMDGESAGRRGRERKGNGAQCCRR
jgi:hypothetical protein